MPGRNNYLAALGDVGGELGLAWLDLSTGEFRVPAAEPRELGALLARLAPGEMLVAPSACCRIRASSSASPNGRRMCSRRCPPARFDSATRERRLEALYGVKALDAFGAFGAPRSPPRHAGRLRRADPEGPAAAPLAPAAPGDRRGHGDRRRDPAQPGAGPGPVRRPQGQPARRPSTAAVTGAGARLLAARLAAPLTDPEEIARASDMVGYLLEPSAARATARALLKALPRPGARAVAPDPGARRPARPGRAARRPARGRRPARRCSAPTRRRRCRRPGRGQTTSAITTP